MLFQGKSVEPESGRLKLDVAVKKGWWVEAVIGGSRRFSLGTEFASLRFYFRSQNHRSEVENVSEIMKYGS